VGLLNGKHFYGEPKRQRIPYDVKKSVCKVYGSLCRKLPGGDMKSLFLNTKKLSK
jgi:hypothetical protein